MITETDVSGVITYANKRFLEFTGFPKRELIGLPHSIVRHPDTPVGLYTAMWEIISSRKVWRGYLKSLCKDGSFFWALLYIQPKLDDKGDIVGYVASRRDAYADAVKDVEARYNALQGEAHIGDEYFMRTELYHGEDMATFTSHA